MQFNEYTHTHTHTHTHKHTSGDDVARGKLIPTDGNDEAVTGTWTDNTDEEEHRNRGEDRDRDGNGNGEGDGDESGNEGREELERARDHIKR